MNREELGNNVSFIMRLFIKSLASEDIGMAITTDGDFVFHHNKTGVRCMVKAKTIGDMWEEYNK